MSITLPSALTTLRRRWPWVVAALVLLLVATRVPGWISGPVVVAYRVEVRPLLANVVATGSDETPKPSPRWPMAEKEPCAIAAQQRDHRHSR